MMACSDQPLSRQRLLPHLPTLPPVVRRILRGLDVGGWGMFVTVSGAVVFLLHIGLVIT